MTKIAFGVAKAALEKAKRQQMEKAQEPNKYSD